MKQKTWFKKLYEKVFGPTEIELALKIEGYKFFMGVLPSMAMHDKISADEANETYDSLKDEKTALENEIIKRFVTPFQKYKSQRNTEEGLASWEEKWHYFFYLLESNNLDTQEISPRLKKIFQKYQKTEDIYTLSHFKTPEELECEIPDKTDEEWAKEDDNNLANDTSYTNYHIAHIAHLTDNECTTAAARMKRDAARRAYTPQIRDSAIDDLLEEKKHRTHLAKKLTRSPVTDCVCDYDETIGIFRCDDIDGTRNGYDKELLHTLLKEHFSLDGLKDNQLDKQANIK